MYEHRAASPSGKPLPPLGTIAAARKPGDVRVGDFVYVDGAYLQVQDMRSVGIGGHRVLIFTGHQPWVMSKAATTYRVAEYR